MVILCYDRIIFMVDLKKIYLAGSLDSTYIRFGNLVKTQSELCCNSKAMGIQLDHNIRIRLAQLKKMLAVSALLAVSAKLRQPTGQRQSNVRTQQKINRDNLILIL